MDEVFQLVIFAIILLLGLLGGRKKKPSARSPGQRPSSRTDAARTRRPVPPPPSRRPRRPAEAVSPSSPPSRPQLEERLLDLLEGKGRRAEVPEEGDAARVEGPAPVFEARSLEELEISPEERHAEFHDRYVEPLPPRDAPGERERPRVRLFATPGTLRQAVIWHAVLGPPKSLEDD